MKNALILHGAGNNSSGNWFPWLKKELENKGYYVVAPDLPNSETPIQKDWLKAIQNYDFNNETVLIGHSSGGTLILRILENLPTNIKIKKVILVASPIDKGQFKKFWQYKEDLCKNPFNWQKIKNRVAELILFYSDNDPYDCGIRHGEVIKQYTGGKLIFQKGEGHFNLEVGKKYQQFPELLNYI